MNPNVDVAVVHDGRPDEEIIRALLGSDIGVRVVAYVEGQGHRIPYCDVLVVACTAYGEDAAALINEAVGERPERPVVLITEGAPNGYVDEAFASGVADIVVLPTGCTFEVASALAPQVRFTLNKAAAAAKIAATGHAAATGRLIVMIGPKGGSGKTLTTTNLAVSLADIGRSVCIIDLDLQFGDIGLALGLPPDQTIYELMSAGGAIDAEKLDAYLATHASGVRALLAPRRPDQAGRITVDFLSRLYPVLREMFDFVIVDTPPNFTPEVISAVDVSTDTCLVGMLDALSLKNTRLGIETLERMGYAPDRIRFLLNRADSQVGISLEDVDAIVGRTPDVSVPSDRNITRSVNEGTPISIKTRSSEAAKAFHALASIFAGNGMDAVVAPVKKRRWRRLSLARNR